MWPSTFHNFSNLPNEAEKKVESTPYQIGNYEFKILLYPGGRRSDPSSVSMYLELCKPATPTPIKFILSILEQNETKRPVVTQTDSSYEFVPGTSCYAFGNPRCILRSDLVKNVLAFTNDQLTVLCEIFELDRPDFLNFLYRPPNHIKYFNNEDLSDVKITVGDRIIHAHKVLICNYEVFAAMFEHGTKESIENVISIDDIKFEVMLELIRFIYTGQVHKMEKIVKDLLIAADKYNISELKDQCGKYLCRTLSVYNVLELMSFASVYHERELEKVTMAFFITHRKDVRKLDDFKKMVGNMGDNLKTQLITILTDL
ncbi:hypothetical protein QAD02_011093 [Eretmocerus hayati]|uniref:Uncharacterized protein n=1 Tax=Eretmocerus hayati TaxID=131215 RepID=A0ACC2NVZ9_9HYME|nr:hypothetical protein QAD02_011093 [Eretmocerus hayati]